LLFSLQKNKFQLLTKNLVSKNRYFSAVKNKIFFSHDNDVKLIS